MYNLSCAKALHLNSIDMGSIGCGAQAKESGQFLDHIEILIMDFMPMFFTRPLLEILHCVALNLFVVSD